MIVPATRGVAEKAKKEAEYRRSHDQAEQANEKEHAARDGADPSRVAIAKYEVRVRQIEAAVQVCFHDGRRDQPQTQSEGDEQ